MEVPYPDHRRPLYLEGQISDVFIRRALVDTGSSDNILPLFVLTASGIPLSKIVQSQTSISGFGNQSEVTVGYMQMWLITLCWEGHGSTSINWWSLLTINV
ncbi:unnamed protein product [Prunus armeniaca]